MELTIDKKMDGNVTVLSPRGFINSHNAVKLLAAIHKLDYNQADLTLDFSDLEYITSAGLRVLLMARKKFGPDRIRIIHMNDMVKDVFEISGFSDIIPVIQDEERQQPDI